MKLNLNNVALKITAGTIKQFPHSPQPQIAFSGRSNVGKSSLINSLIQRKSLARVSGEPGKTITVNFYDIDRKLYLVDLPGYGYAKRSLEDKERWSLFTDGFFTNNDFIDSVKLVCQLIDSRNGPTSDDLDMIYYMRETALPFVIIGTKTDKLNATEKKAFFERLKNEPITADIDVIMYSAKTNSGRDELWKKILASCEG